MQKQIPDARVTIFTDKTTPDTTADGAAGIYGLYLMGNTPLDKQVKIKYISVREFLGPYGPPNSMAIRATYAYNSRKIRHRK